MLETRFDNIILAVALKVESCPGLYCFNGGIVGLFYNNYLLLDCDIEN